MVLIGQLVFEGCILWSEAKGLDPEGYDDEREQAVWNTLGAEIRAQILAPP
jgi:hypothetical protein